MHKIYHFGNIDGEVFGEFIVISDQPESVVIAEHCPSHMRLDYVWDIEGEPCTLPCDRILKAA